MHYIQCKTILSANQGMNLYRGCSHGCIYCDSRSECYQMDHSFEDIAVKENALELLELALMKKKKKTMIGMGAMSDPYMPLENQLFYTRKALQLALKYQYGITLITKSNLVLRDLDLLKQINQQTKCVIQMTLTTYDENLCKILEPHVCSTKERFETLKILHQAEIETVVWLTPILPFINDNLENLKGILDYCRQAHVKGIICFDMGVTLRKGNREYFYQQLDRYFPKMKEKYMKTYGEAYILSSPHNQELMDYFIKYCKKYHIMYDHQQIFAYLKHYEQKQFQQLQLF